jgi:transposase
VRATTLLNRLLELPGVRVTGVSLAEAGEGGSVVVDVTLRRRALVRPWCSFSTGRRYDRRQVDSSWRHLDLGGRVCRLRMRRRRLACPEHGVVTEAVPFARAGARFTTDFEDLVMWLVTRSEKSTVAAFARVAWRTSAPCVSRHRETGPDAAGRAGRHRGGRDLLA